MAEKKEKTTVGEFFDSNILGFLLGLGAASFLGEWTGAFPWEAQMGLGEVMGDRLGDAWDSISEVLDWDVYSSEYARTGNANLAMDLAGDASGYKTALEHLSEYQH